MTKYKTWFTVCMFWVPLGLCFLLNPGAGGKNVANFSKLELGVFIVCSSSLVIFATANLLPLRAKRIMCTTESGAWVAIRYFAFAMFFGLLGIYAAMRFGKWS